MQTSILIIFKIAGSFTALFVLPFVLVTSRVFPQQDKLFQVYISMIIGLFCSVALVYLLAIFNVFNKVNFLISYGSVIFVSNLYFLRQTKHPKVSFKLRLTPSFALLLFAFGIGSYMRLYEPLQHVSLGSGDFYWHLRFLKSTAVGLVFTAYPRGYHIILTLIHYLSNLDSYLIARFVGAFFGIVSIGAVYCLVKHVFSTKAAILATIFYSGFSLFNYLIIEEIGFFSQGFGFVLIPFLIYFALKLVNNFKEDSVRKRNILVFIFIVFLLSLISPYTMLQMSYVLYFVLFFSIAFHPSIRKHIRKFLRKVIALTILFSLGILIVFSYYTTLRKFHNVGLRLPIYDELKMVRLIDEGKSRWEAMEESAILADWTTHKWAIVKALLRVKRLRVPVEFPLSIGVYIGLLLSFFVLLFGIVRRRLDLFTLGIFIFLFGVSCITGILEFSTYAGRSGWYFMLGSIWLGGIIVKKFYDQELMKDILNIFKRVVPIQITNKAKNIKKLKVSLIYLPLTLSGLVGYLVIIWVLGLLKLNPIREASFLLLIPIMIFIVGKRKRDVLSGESVLCSLPEKTRLYLSLHKTLVLTGILVIMLYPLPKPPEYNFRYYHRSINEDDFVKVVQKIKDNYLLSEVKLFFDNDIIRAATTKTISMVYPQRLEITQSKDIPSGIGDKRYNFLFVDRGKEKSQVFKKIREWLSWYKQQHNNIRVFYQSENIMVYLLENYEVLNRKEN